MFEAYEDFFLLKEGKSLSLVYHLEPGVGREVESHDSPLVLGDH
jgi:hypothetical protein